MEWIFDGIGTAIITLIDTFCHDRIIESDSLVSR